MTRHLRPTDGPGAGRRLTLEPWQRGFLHAVDRERKPIVSLMAASQLGKTLLALGIGIRAAVDGQGVLLASATETSVRDLGRRLDSTLEHAPAIARRFPSPRSGPGARASWKDRRVDGGGWIGLAASGSASQLASRTVKIALADEVSRWPARVRSGEGHPLALLRDETFGLGRRRAIAGHQFASASKRLDRAVVSRRRSPPHGVRLSGVRSPDAVRVGPGDRTCPRRSAHDRLSTLRNAPRRTGAAADAP